MKKLVVNFVLIYPYFFAQAIASPNDNRCLLPDPLTDEDWARLQTVVKKERVNVKHPLPQRIATVSSAIYLYLGKFSNLYRVRTGKIMADRAPKAMTMIFEDLAKRYLNLGSFSNVIKDLESSKGRELLEEYGREGVFHFYGFNLSRRKRVAPKDNLTILVPHLAIVTWALMTFADINFDHLALDTLHDVLCDYTLRLGKEVNAVSPDRRVLEKRLIPKVSLNPSLEPDKNKAKSLGRIASVGALNYLRTASCQFLISKSRNQPLKRSLSCDFQ